MPILIQGVPDWVPLSWVPLRDLQGTESKARKTNRLGRLGRGSYDGLLELLPGVVNEHADDAEGYDAGCSAEKSDKGRETVYFANDFGLLVLFVGMTAVEEELIFFVTGDLPTVGEQEEECEGDYTPDDEHCGQSVHRFVPLREAREPMSTVPVYRAGPLCGLGG